MDNTAKINLLYWNARSIKGKSIETHNFLIDNNIHIALFNETWLKNTDKFSFPDYHCYRLDREERRGGGVAIVVRKGLQHQLLPDLQLNVIEAIGISLRIGNENVKIVSVYFPGSTRTPVLAQYRGDIRRLTADRSSYIVCGDLNSRHRLWGCIRANGAGKVLFEENCTGGFIINHPHASTYYPENSAATPSTLDIMLTNGLCNISNLTVHNALSSDHRPVTFEIDSNGIEFISEQLVSCYRRADWVRFQNFLNGNVVLNNSSPELLNPGDIDHMVSFITEKIQEAIDLSVPKVHPMVFRYILPERIRLLIRLRNARRRQWQRTRSPYLGSVVSFMNENIKSAISKFRNNEWSALLSTLRVTDNKFWKTTKILKRKQSILPVLRLNGDKITSDQEKIEIIADRFSGSHLLTVNQNSTAEIENAVSEKIAELNNSGPADVQGGDLTSPGEIRSILKRLKNRKAPGPDGINNLVLKNLPRMVLVYLTYVFNACMKIQYFPEQWRRASVVAIPKPGKDPSDPASYRPISLLCSLSKVFERIILTRVLDYTVMNGVLPDCQFGFRSRHSTCHQVVRLTNEISRGFRERLSTGMLLLDIEKAFDTVWHDGLIYKMSIKNYPVYLLKLTRSFLTGRDFSLHYHGLVSRTHQIPAGLPQGATMSPTLYGIFTSDPPALNGCEMAVFADDTAIFCTNSSVAVIVQSLQDGIDALQNYYISWKIKINPAKSQCIYFTKRRSPRYLPQTDLRICGSDVPWSADVKYLGVILDRKLLFRSHIEYALEKTGKMFRIFYSMLNRKSRMNTKNKLVLYKVALRSILIYCCPVWANCALSHKNRVQIMQNKFLKTILNLPWHHSTREVHEMAEIELINDRVASLTDKFIESCQSSENPLIASIYADA
jgi:hypothetical protein